MLFHKRHLEKIDSQLDEILTLLSKQKHNDNHTWSKVELERINALYKDFSEFNHYFNSITKHFIDDEDFFEKVCEGITNNNSKLSEQIIEQLKKIKNEIISIEQVSKNAFDHLSQIQVLTHNTIFEEIDFFEKFKEKIEELIDHSKMLTKLFIQENNQIKAEENNLENKEKAIKHLVHNFESWI